MGQRRRIKRIQTNCWEYDEYCDRKSSRRTTTRNGWTRVSENLGVLLCVSFSALFSLSALSTRLTDVFSLSFGTVLLKITAPRFQLTRYYRYGEMDNCEEFWEDF